MSSDTLGTLLSPSLPALSSCPPARRVPAFAPLRVGPARYRLRPVLRRRRRTASGALALAAAVLAVAAGPPPAAVRTVSAPVRIADAATVRLLRPGDRVDVVAAGRSGPPRVVAAGARVSRVPPPAEEAGAAGDGGALVVLSVPRETARELVGAAATARLAVALC
ncbi:hypothetical protein ACIQV2_17670 [Streptomyces globosus]|uniref:hypothetical protein n=1 Tax=Streptomyces globosus TaxID=68209 RepID=UPI00382165B9